MDDSAENMTCAGAAHAPAEEDQTAEDSLRELLDEAHAMRREAKWMEARSCMMLDRLVLATTPHLLAVAEHHELAAQARGALARGSSYARHTADACAATRTSSSSAAAASNSNSSNGNSSSSSQAILTRPM